MSQLVNIVLLGSLAFLCTVSADTVEDANSLLARNWNDNVLLDTSNHDYRDEIFASDLYNRAVRSSYSTDEPNPTGMLPVMRTGRSDASSFSGMVPIMRSGRSEMLPVMRVGRSSTGMVPIMRAGRSSLPLGSFPHVDQLDGSMLPTMRVGRSDGMLPIMRAGRSSSMVPVMRTGRSDPTSMVPLMRMGRSMASRMQHSSTPLAAPPSSSSSSASSSTAYAPSSMASMMHTGHTSNGMNHPHLHTHINDESFFMHEHFPPLNNSQHERFKRSIDFDFNALDADDVSINKDTDYNVDDDSDADYDVNDDIENDLNFDHLKNARVFVLPLHKIRSKYHLNNLQYANSMFKRARRQIIPNPRVGRRSDRSFHRKFDLNKLAPVLQEKIIHYKLVGPYFALTSSVEDDSGSLIESSFDPIDLQVRAVYIPRFGKRFNSNSAPAGPASSLKKASSFQPRIGRSGVFYQPRLGRASFDALTDDAYDTFADEASIDSRSSRSMSTFQPRIGRSVHPKSSSSSVLSTSSKSSA